MQRDTPLSEKRYFTTGDIAKMCGVNYRTAIRWADAGFLKSFELPGPRGDRRFHPKDFISFLIDNNMPIPEELQPPTKTVLIVDDEQPMARAIQRALKRAGFETMIATDGFLAGALATTHQPSVISLDLEMPGLGGLQVLKAIRQIPDLVSTKVLVVSAMHQEQLDEAIEAGANDWLAKPFKNKVLVEKVRDLAEELPIRRTPYHKAR